MYVFENISDGTSFISCENSGVVRTQESDIVGYKGVPIGQHNSKLNFM